VKFLNKHIDILAGAIVLVSSALIISKEINRIKSEPKPRRNIGGFPYELKRKKYAHPRF
jgi:hypothetical protein